MALSRTVFSTKSPGWLRTAIAAGTMALTIGPIDPGKVAFFDTTSQAATTAPQRVWPSTRISGAPRTAAPYSMVPMVAVSTMLPALRATKSSPRPRPPNNSSGGTRLSEQLTMVAHGACDSASLLRRACRSAVHSSGLAT